jgi:hypothetical protein
MTNALRRHSIGHTDGFRLLALPGNAQSQSANGLAKRTRPHQNRPGNQPTTAPKTRPKRALSAIAIAAAATTTTTATSPPWRALFSRACLIHSQRSALKVLLVEHRYRFGGVFLRSHLDKSETTGAARGPVLHDIDCHHPACLCEVILQIVFGCGERKVTYE